MVRLRLEVDREREERNFFQLERDKVNTFWDISKRQLDESRAMARNKERELEDAEERHQVEIKVREGTFGLLQNVHCICTGTSCICCSAGLYCKSCHHLCCSIFRCTSRK